MLRVGTAYSELKFGPSAAEAAARSALDKAGLSSARNLLFFITPHHKRSYQAIYDTLRKISGAFHIVGASGYGIITDEKEVEDKPSISVMVIDGDDLESTSFFVPNLQENNFEAGHLAAQKLKQADIDPDFLLLFPDVFSFQSHMFFDGFEQSFGSLPIVGGAAAENGTEYKTFQMANGRIGFDSVAGLAFGGDIRFETGVTKSCQPFGEPLQITKSDGTTIYEIDGRPAYDILLESLSAVDINNADRIMQNVFFGVPLRSYQTDFSGSDYLIRNITGMNAKKGMLSCLSPISEGEYVTFAVRDAHLAKAHFRETLRDLKERISPEEASFGLYFNSFTRGSALYADVNQDIQLIKEFYPELPVTGFFTYGEIAPLDYVNLLHLHSGVLLIASKRF